MCGRGERQQPAVMPVVAVPAREIGLGTQKKKAPLVKSSDARTRTALIVLTALSMVGGWLGQASQPAAAVVPGANGRIVFQSTRDGDTEIYSMSPKGELGKHGQKA